MPTNVKVSINKKAKFVQEGLKSNTRSYK